MDEPSSGNLRLSTGKILTYLSLLMPAFSLVCSPALLSVHLLPNTQCSSTDLEVRSQMSDVGFYLQVTHTSLHEPMLMLRNLLKSATDCLPYPSAMFSTIDKAALLS